MAGGEAQLLDFGTRSSLPLDKKPVRVTFQVGHAPFAADKNCPAWKRNFDRFSIGTRRIAGDWTRSLRQSEILIGHGQQPDSLHRLGNRRAFRFDGWFANNGRRRQGRQTERGFLIGHQDCGPVLLQWYDEGDGVVGNERPDLRCRELWAKYSKRRICARRFAGLGRLNADAVMPGASTGHRDACRRAVIERISIQSRFRR